MRVEKSPPSVSSNQLKVHSVTWRRHVTRLRIGCMTLAVKFRGGAVIGASFLGCRTRGWLASHDHTCIFLTLVLPRSLLLCSFSFVLGACSGFTFCCLVFLVQRFYFFLMLLLMSHRERKKKTKTKEQKKISKTKRQNSSIIKHGII